MNYRASEYMENGLTARWLDTVRARNAYHYALQFSAKHRYGLCECTVEGIQRLEIGSLAVADAWLHDRLSAVGTVQIVYSDDEVCVLPATEFLQKWQHIFLPGRDDAIVHHNLGTGILFYSHEAELEFGHRKVQPRATASRRRGGVEEGRARPSRAD